MRTAGWKRKAAHQSRMMGCGGRPALGTPQRVMDLRAADGLELPRAPAGLSRGEGSASDLGLRPASSIRHENLNPSKPWLAYLKEIVIVRTSQRSAWGGGQCEGEEMLSKCQHQLCRHHRPLPITGHLRTTLHAYHSLSNCTSSSTWGGAGREGDLPPAWQKQRLG